MNTAIPAEQKFSLHNPPQLMDAAGRSINYLRLAITDQCNLRCRYCMPGENVRFLEQDRRLTLEELKTTCRIMAELGIEKIRITGGEPFTHPGIMDLLSYLNQLPAIKSLHITTNGILTAPHIPQLAQMGLAGLNISLDSLNRENFLRITHRDKFEAVWETMQAALQHKIPLKINTVILDDLNTHEISDFMKLARENPLELRFIEQMPFSGKSGKFSGRWNVEKIIAAIEREYPDFSKNSRRSGTARIFQLPGFKGKVGIISGYSRNFCSSCNRIRVTSEGFLQTCLYDRGKINLRELIRAGKNDASVKMAILAAIQQKEISGHVAEQKNPGAIQSSMAAIGG